MGVTPSPPSEVMVGDDTLTVEVWTVRGKFLKKQVFQAQFSDNLKIFRTASTANQVFQLFSNLITIFGFKNDLCFHFWK